MSADKWMGAALIAAFVASAAMFGAVRDVSEDDTKEALAEKGYQDIKIRDSSFGENLRLMARCGKHDVKHHFEASDRNGNAVQGLICQNGLTNTAKIVPTVS